jgi:hypothetical protein
MRRLLRAARATLGALGCLAALAPSQGQAEALEANEVKAAVVYHLSLFADWPAQSGAAEGFELCVLTDDDAMAQALGRLGGKTVKGTRIEVTRKRPGQELADCRMLYLGELSDSARARGIAQVAGKAVLSVANGGSRVAGAIVSIGVAGERVYFDIDLGAAQGAGLRLDAKLLRLARRVAR